MGRAARASRCGLGQKTADEPSGISPEWLPERWAWHQPLEPAEHPWQTRLGTPEPICGAEP